MRPMQLPKAGVLSDEPVKENDNSDSCMDEPTTPEIHIPALHTDSHQLIHPNELDSKVMLISAEEVREEEWFMNFFKNSAMMCVFRLIGYYFWKTGCCKTTQVPQVSGFAHV